MRVKRWVDKCVVMGKPTFDEDMDNQDSQADSANPDELNQHYANQSASGPPGLLDPDRAVSFVKPKAIEMQSDGSGKISSVTSKVDVTKLPSATSKIDAAKSTKAISKIDVPKLPSGASSSPSFVFVWLTERCEFNASDAKLYADAFDQLGIDTPEDLQMRDGDDVVWPSVLKPVHRKKIQARLETNII